MISRTELIFCLFVLIFHLQLIHSLSFDDELDKILKENLRKYGVKTNEQENRFRRSDKPGIHFETKQRQEADLPICQNMKGILGKLPFVVIFTESMHFFD